MKSHNYAVEMPEDATRVVLRALEIDGVVEEDLQYFVNIITMDVSDNQVRDRYAQ